MPDPGQAVDKAVREGLMEQRQEMLGLQRPVRLAPDGQCRLFRERCLSRLVGRLERVRAGREALGPADGAGGLVRRGKRSAVSL